MDKPVKVLYFVDYMFCGGIQSLVIDWVSKFNKEKIQVDFLLLDDGNKYELEEKLKKIGCNVYKLTGIWINSPIDFIKEAKSLNKFFDEHHDYKVVHLHSSSKNYMVLKYAKKYGIPVRIAHSHNIDFQTKNPIKKLYGNFLKPKLEKYSTDFFACSKDAGKWLFGQEIIKSNKFKIIHNAIDYDKFKYNEKYRKDRRKEFGFNENDIVIGHVGRFVNQKNHKFLIDMFNECYKKNNNYKLLLIGSGQLENKIKEKVKILNLEKNVVFAGFREDVNECIQAMDIFAFPSLFEGLGLVLVEAQASGLPCFATKATIPDEVKINENFKFIDLQLNKWIDHILKCNLNRIETKENIMKNNYLINDTIQQLENIYIIGK